MTDTPETFDAILIGAGQANNPLSRSLAGGGRRVARVERGEIGGTCVNWGCTPTKTMAASARVACLARRAADYGVDVGGSGRSSRSSGPGARRSWRRRTASPSSAGRCPSPARTPSE